MGKQKGRLLILLFTVVYFFSSTVAPVFAAISYTYDANGNMSSDGTNCYTYNEANQLKEVKNCSNNQTIAQYAYDYQGNRIVKKTYTGGNLQKTAYSPDDSYETVKLASNGATQNTSYYFANDQLIAKKDPSGNKTYYQNDHLGSASLITNQSGNLVENTKYYPFGEIRSGGTQSKYLYTGQERDGETGLDYYNARYYSDHLRRFVQPDSLIPDAYDPQALNRYSYVDNNPLRYTDPSGRFAIAALIPLLTNPVVLVGAALIGAVYLATPQGQTQTKAAISYVANTIFNIPSAINTATKAISTAFSKPATSTISTSKTSTPQSSISKGNPPGGGGNSSKGPNPFQKIGPAIPIAANNTWQKIKDNGLQPLEGYSSKIYKNVTEPFLPETPLGTYMEHDVFPEGPNGEREMHRLVIDTITGQAWYTYHYLDGFVPFNK